ncbi:hypothetical protein D1007_49396 [Hordeum vulgare]|nr:hypothetical protein D1007_49396 [Hordeum vulgare]
MAREFIVRMEDMPCTWLRLPDSSVGEMEKLAHLGMWLQPDSCCNRPTCMAIEFNNLGFMSLGHGWKSFALSQGLQEGHVLHFKFFGASTLFVKTFGSVGGRLECCLEGDSSVNSSPSHINGSGSSPSRGVRVTTTMMAARALLSRRRRNPTKRP